MNYKYVRLLLSATLFITSMFLVTNALVKWYGTSAQEQTVPLITLQSSERILESVPYGSSLASADGKQIYVLRRDTDSISVYDSEHKRAKDLRGFGQTAKLMGLSAEGRMYVATKSEVH